MKKLVILLLSAAIGKALCSQVVPFNNPAPPSELTFNSPLPGKSRIRFDFILPNNNKMIIEVQRLHIIQQLPNLDSLFDKIWDDLSPIYDSLTDPLLSRRVDYVQTGTEVKIRFKQYTPTGTYYSYKDDELVQMKIDQDTLRFKGTIRPYPGHDRGIRFLSSYYTVTLLLNNITDVAKLPEGILQSGMELLLPDLKRSLEKSPGKVVDNYYYGIYDIKTKKRISPRDESRVGYSKRKSIDPFAQVGIQYVRGAFVPSAGAGIEFSVNEQNYSKHAIRLIWEPYFYFMRDDKDKVVLQRNDFITLKFYTGYTHVGPGRTFSWNQNFSIGALIYRKGELFEKGTFKFELPGLQSKNLVLTPEFFFNKFFRNVSPSMKLTVNLD